MQQDRNEICHDRNEMCDRISRMKKKTPSRRRDGQLRTGAFLSCLGRPEISGNSAPPGLSAMSISSETVSRSAGWVPHPMLF